MRRLLVAAGYAGISVNVFVIVKGHFLATENIIAIAEPGIPDCASVVAVIYHATFAVDRTG